MSYDVPFRHNQALDPSALVTVGTTLHAIRAAITCQSASNRDPLSARKRDPLGVAWIG